MPETLADEVAKAAQKAASCYHRLVILTGPPGAGKTASLRDLARAHGWPLININLRLSERLMELTTRQRALRVARIVDDIVEEEGADTTMLDNIEMLFHPELKQDPLRLLQSLSRNRTIIASWRGRIHGDALTYASPEHPEFRRFDDPQALIVAGARNHTAGRETASSKEH